ncbi:MAG: TIGR03768 family metallophosphoesterase [Ignavibacteria bacterium]|nr:TIGR03768 family metallophosphoesterase [Ignavibacteria bacterium]
MRRRNSIWICTMLLIGFVLISNCNSQQATNQLNSKVFTTQDRTIVPDFVPVVPAVRIDDPANFEKYGYGKWHYGPGLPIQKRLDLMPAGYVNTSVSNAATLLRFFTMTDIHITDKESPGQALFFAPYVGENGISVCSPLMLYTTQMLDAAVQTINDLHRENPFDFGIALGDMANSTQYNEVRWFIDVLDGKEINPDSGIKDDPIPGPNNDYQDIFKAAGLDKSIPWYATMGNHDHFWLGSKPLNDRMKKALVGDSILQLGFILDKDPNAMNERTYSTGTYDCSKLYAPIIGSGVVAKMKNIPTIPPDANRRSLSTMEVLNEFSNTISEPKGHGFIQSNPENVFGACYSFEPKSNLPLKIIVLDDTQDNSDAPVKEGIFGHGELNKGRYEWMMKQLKAGQEANQLMIISAHIPIGVCYDTPMDWNPAEGYKSEKDLVAQLQSFPNLILWVAGHRHLNNVTAFPSTDAAHPENSFWEVETKSLREFPEQFRTFDIVRNSDNTISIFTINVDPNIKEGSQAEIGRTYAIASGQIYGLTEKPLPTGSVSYNAELVKQLSPEMQAKIKDYGTPIKK